MKKISVILFHLVAFVITLLAFAQIILELNRIRDWNIGFFTLNPHLAMAHIFVVLSYILGSISLLLFFQEWRKYGKIRIYIISFLIGQLLFLTGNALIILVK